MTSSLTTISAATLFFRRYSGGIRLHSIMLHRVLKAHGLGDALCNLPCQYPSLTSTAVKRVLPADWMLLNLRCNADFPSLAMALLLSLQAFTSRSWSTWQKYRIHPQETYAWGAWDENSLITCEGNILLQRQRWGALPSSPLP